jgi:hypothetical protein
LIISASNLIMEVINSTEDFQVCFLFLGIICHCFIMPFLRQRQKYSSFGAAHNSSQDFVMICRSIIIKIYYKFGSLKTAHLKEKNSFIKNVRDKSFIHRCQVMRSCGWALFCRLASVLLPGFILQPVAAGRLIVPPCRSGVVCFSILRG